MKFVNADDECIGHICIPDGYDKTILPFQNETNHVKVDFKGGIRILKVDHEEFTITLSFFLYMYWFDARLKVESPSEDILYNRNTNTFIPLNSEIMAKIWLPNPYIFDVKNMKSSPDSNYLMDKKYIIQTMDIKSITIYCSMVFDYYPLDSHVCYLKRKH